MPDCEIQSKHMDCGAAGQKSQPAVATGLVGGMQIDPAKAAAKSEYRGKTCHEELRREPGVIPEQGQQAKVG